MSLADDSPSREQARLIGLLLALVTLLVYLPAGFHDFIFFDDPAYVADNGVVQSGLTWAGLKWAFVGWHASNWHPVTWLSHMLDCQLVGLNPGAQHLINALLHAVNAVLLFHLWRRLTGALWPSALVAAFFAWHPLHVESVAWIAERKDVLSTLFGLLASLAYVNYARSRNDPGRTQPVRWGSYAGAPIFFLLGLMSKPMLVTLPFVFLLLDYWPLGRMRNVDFKARMALLWEKTPFLALAAASAVVTFLAQRGEAVVSLHERSPGLRVETAVVAWAGYVFKTVWPSPLAIIYPLPARYPAGTVAAAAIFLAAVSAAVWWRRRPSPWLLMGWLWFLGTLVPVIGLVQAGSQFMADRYTYWPSVGLFVAVVFGAAEWTGRHQRFLVPAGVAAGLALCGAIAVTEHQLGYWKDTRTLFAHTLAVTTDNPQAQMILGVPYERAGAIAQAVQCYEAALQLDGSLVVQMPGGTKRPLAVQVVLLQAQAAEQQGDRTNAMALYEQALKRDPTLVEAHNNLANLLDESGATPEALAHYQAAIRLAPGAALAHDNLGTMWLNHGQFEAALGQYQAAAQLAPEDPRAFFLAGKAWLRHGQSGLASAQFRQALERDPNDPQALTFLARILATDSNPTNRDGSAAVALAERANAQTGGGQPFILDVLAAAYAEAGRFGEAQATAAQAAELAAAAKLPDMAAGIRRHLDLFQARQPDREEFTNTLPAP